MIPDKYLRGLNGYDIDKVKELWNEAYEVGHTKGYKEGYEDGQQQAYRTISQIDKRGGKNE